MRYVRSHDFSLNISFSRPAAASPLPHQEPLLVVTQTVQAGGDLLVEGSRPKISRESLSLGIGVDVSEVTFGSRSRLAATSSSGSKPEVIGFYKWSCHIPFDAALVTDRQAVTNCQE